MKATLLEIVTSKKALAMIVGIILALTNRIGLQLAPDELQMALGVIAAYLVGQGIADHNSTAAKITADAMTGQGPIVKTQLTDGVIVNARVMP